MRADINLSETAKVAEAHKGWVVSQYTESGRKQEDSVNQTTVRELITRSMQKHGTKPGVPDTRTEDTQRRIDPDL